MDRGSKDKRISRKEAQKIAEDEFKAAAAEEKRLKALADAEIEEVATLKRLQQLGLPSDIRSKPPQPAKEERRSKEETKRTYPLALKEKPGHSTGNTRLMWAAGHGMQDHISLLLSQPGVHVDERNHDGWTALFYACYNDRLECCDQLLAAGADPNLHASDGTTPLMFSATAGKGNIRICMNLIDRGGADVNAIDHKGYTALMKSVLKNNIDMVRALLEYPQTDLNISDGEGVSALIIAVSNGYLEIVQMLCSLPEVIVKKEKENEGGKGGKGGKGKAAQIIPGLQVNKPDKQGYTALMYSAQSNHPSTSDIVTCLLRMEGINVNIQSLHFSNALTIATKFAHVDTVRQLLDLAPPGCEDKPSLRCDVNAFEIQKGTALITAAVDFPYISSPHTEEFWRQRLEIVRLLIDHGANLYVTDVDERSPDEVAVGYGGLEVGMVIREAKEANDRAMG